MKKLFYLVILFSNFTTLSQTKYYFYVELSNLSERPNISINNDETLNLTFKNIEINKVFEKYKIYKFEQSCIYCTQQNLLNTFEVESNLIGLMSEITQNFPDIFIKTEQYYAPQLLYTPNDYSLPFPPGWQGGTSFEKRTLNLIGAENAWNITKGNPNVIIGINENSINYNHEEFIGKVVNPGFINIGYHANWVAGLAAGATDNGVGSASIGFNCRLNQSSLGSFNDNITYGAKVINMSWGSPFIPNDLQSVPNQFTQDIINDLSDNSNIVFVAAAGNGIGGNVYASFLTQNGLALNMENYAKQYHYPATYKNVISVSTVGNWNPPNSTAVAYDNWEYVHKIKLNPGFFYPGSTTPIAETEQFHQHNDSIDIVVPAYRIPVVGHPNNGSIPNSYFDSAAWGGIGGTSFTAPIVSGTIGLMQSVNYCLKPKEVESILKLTALNIENIPENLPYYGRLGGGSLDAFKAVEMANEMAKPMGTVTVKDRILYRRWFYKLETAPYEIKMSNNLVTEYAKIMFWARNNIEILSGNYYPDNGYMDLQINETLALNCTIPYIAKQSNSNETEKIISLKTATLYPNPNKGNFKIALNFDEIADVLVEVYDVFGKMIYSTTANEKIFDIDIPNLQKGMYIVKLSNNDYSEVLKFVKE